MSRQTDHSASEFAAFGFAESLRTELARDGSRMDSLVVFPYCIDTGMSDGVRSRYPRLLPTPLFDGVMNALGINDSMDALTGRLVPGCR